MSASPIARQATESKSIPRKILINDLADIPHSYSTTPCGTLYSTTPGGTKIVYEKSFLMSLRNSPVSKTPPSYTIPDQLLLNGQNGKKPTQNNNTYNQNNKNQNQKNRIPPKKQTHAPTSKKEDELFDMEI